MTELHVEDASKRTTPWEREVDVVVVGSGPAGAAAARELARGGVEVLIVEEGVWKQPKDFAADGFSAMASMYRDMGASVMLGNAPMPFVQGKVVGGTSVINGAISWRMPRSRYDAWVREDPALGESMPWEALEARFDEIERDLHIKPTPPEIQGENNRLLGVGAQALGLEHRPIARNVKGCKGLGRCLQGCPEGNKMSMDRSYLQDVCEAGGAILSGVRVEEILTTGGKAVGVRGTSTGGARVTIRARHAVVVAASAVQTPVLLLRSGIRHGPVGERFQCHPGVSVVGRFVDPVRLWEGATQGHEVTGLTEEGIKFEALGFDMAVFGARLKGTGVRWMQDLKSMAHWASWGALVRSSALGRVRPGRGGRAKVRFSMTREDMHKLRIAMQTLGEMMLAAGAEVIAPGVAGWHAEVSDRAVMARFGEDGPLSPKAYTMVTTHMFGTCRMGSAPAHNVVRPDFRHHRIAGLYIADSSVFPTNLGVNPQTSILALASLCGQHILTA